jgi:tRNA threonylcarbamoyladenosine biosynthesis protein TsaB
VSLILNIESAVVGASVCLANGEKVLAFSQTAEQKDTAAWLHPAIEQVMKEGGHSLKELEAIAVSAGPGSYTGLRVGMAAAKGLCFALKISFLCVSTLKMMAAAAKGKATGLLCPMIDARRMEVFTAIYNEELEQVMPETNMILTEQSFSALLDENRISFFGNGSMKFSALVQHPNAAFVEVDASAKDMVLLSLEKFLNKDFEDLAYSEPHYGKEFYSPVSTKTPFI